MMAFDVTQGDYVDRAWAANVVPGEIIFVRTDLGRRVAAWRATGNPPLMQQFFCHGYSLGTFAEHGYSVCSGEHMITVLADEYVKIGDMHSPHVAAGDIVIMWHGFNPVHSAVIVNRAIDPVTNRMNEGLTTLNSKYGTAHIKIGATYTTVKHHDYPRPNLVEVYRRA